MVNQIVITRFKEEELQTLGELTLYDNKELKFECKVLELPWRDNKRRVSRFPAGHYPAVKHISPNFGKSIWIQEVPDRSEILIHVGNYIASNNPRTGKPDSLGCPIVGETFRDITGDGNLDVTNSRNTINRLYELIEHDVYVRVIDDF